jgi:hypothetical protein
VACASLFASVGACGHASSGTHHLDSSDNSYFAWDKCVVGVSGDSSLRDLPPLPWKDPGKNAVMVSGHDVRRAGPLEWHSGMTLGNVLDVSGVSPETPVVVWRCADGRVRAMRPHRESEIAVHDWIVAPDPTSVY